MKKILFILLLALTAGAFTQAQTITKNKYSSAKTTNLQPIPVETQTPPPPPPPAPKSNKPESSIQKSDVTASVYSLTLVRVKIRTGNDNKEFPSKVLVSLSTRNTPVSEWKPFYQLNLDNEMRINSDSEFGLEREAQLRGETKLDVFQREGLTLNIEYLPNFILDAWKIENVSLVLEFKDQNGNLNPLLGTKTIIFNNAYGFLNNDYRHMECVTDGSFTPLTAVIKP